MGILNLTPDSFFDGGTFLEVEHAIARIGSMIADGAAIIDIGGESTRPGSDPVTTEVELNRVIPIVEKAVSQFKGTIFSVDTTKYEVAKIALEAGVHIVNDVSGLRKEPGFANLCGQYNAGYVLMHSIGDPKTMQNNPGYKNIITEIETFFINGISKLKEAGVKSIFLDPGFGFGKTLDHNLKLVKEMQSFLKFGYPVLAGASRKSMIGAILNDRAAEDRLAGTIALHYHCLMNGVRLLRVHDVKEAIDSIKIFGAVMSQ
ncbi:MAG: dihydropteroate synthase [Balneolaceae bacterium]|nr:MAG: dihydropteroate synthase [Balneolaceae bacterium]